MIEIKACPFCGSITPVALHTEESYSPQSGVNHTMYTVICDFNEGGCGSSCGYKYSKEEAIELWNNRIGMNVELTKELDVND